MFLKYFPLLWLGYATSNIYFVCVLHHLTFSFKFIFCVASLKKLKSPLFK